MQLQMEHISVSPCALSTSSTVAAPSKTSQARMSKETSDLLSSAYCIVCPYLVVSVRSRDSHCNFKMLCSQLESWYDKKVMRWGNFWVKLVWGFFDSGRKKWFPCILLWKQFSFSQKILFFFLFQQYLL